MIDKRLVPFSGLKKEPFSGSHQGMRYLLAADNGRDSTTFTAYVYPEPWCFEETPDDEKESASFLDQIRDAMRQYSRLSRTGAGQNQQRAVCVKYKKPDRGHKSENKLNFVIPK